jgi:hypothetical protein
MNASIIRRTFTRAQNTGNKKPNKTNKTPKEKSNVVFSSEQVMHMFNMMQNILKEPPKKKKKVSEIEANAELK